ncbi:Lysine exporter protein (LYSE/YGGA) [Kribbella flavida DSM 17836]|uniref:Lysine exporter protein (LYSE/YGGA) n=1 Tax=Kribbella flavida (strain DSM 17836 / JCM 10339 / NBRC 14399) TaxID=479435 RepID=D2PSF9_KRIFD|nr:LysE family translocator [Kribbella flavida]ADB33097.1 Lysine exporter protein (LYSE/YGGA) [Kribbella flavida DSM 17836]
MLDVGVLPGFVAVILLFLVPPGPDMAYLVAVGLVGGRGAALKAISGIGTGMSVYAAAVVVGVAEIARTHPRLLDAVKLFGAAYLLWLASVTLRNAHTSADGSSDISSGRPYLRGVMVSLTNPKVILFFLAVLPQFLGDTQNAGLQLAMLGAVTVLVEVLLYGTIGVLAGAFQARFRRSGKAGAGLNYLAGIVYLVLAGAILTELILK